jgi:hypothetical protein
MAMPKRSKNDLDTSQSMQRMRAASSNMSTTDTQTNEVRKSNKRIMVLGMTKAWTPPNKSRSRRQQTKELGKPRSTSSWYCIKKVRSLFS